MDLLGGVAQSSSAVPSTLAPLPPTREFSRAKIIVAPHAGYVYSGAVAAAAFSLLSSRSEIRRVVLLGPAHRMYFRGAALPGVDQYATPLGRVPIDAEARALLQREAGVIEAQDAHALEHSLEVEVPFLQLTLPSPFTLIPLLIGDASPDAVAALLSKLWFGPETLIVISSDLSHFLPYAAARRADAKTAERVLALDPVLTHDDACGATPLNAALVLARERRLHCSLVDLRNSADAAKDASTERVVGYGSFVLCP
jgi:AmmeMemoRadiSam system protein B